MPADSTLTSSCADLSFRHAWDDELPRVRSLFPSLVLAGALDPCFVAARARPVERLVGAAVWQEAAGPDGTPAAEFRWRTLPSLADTPQERAFLLALVGALAATGRWGQLRTADPLPEGTQSRLLEGCGFTPAYRHDGYASEWDCWVRRTRRLLARPRQVPPDLEVVAPTSAHAAALVALAADQFHLISAQEVRAALAPTGPGAAFDPACSALLWLAGRLVGACLVNPEGASHVSIPVLAVDAAGTLPAGLVCALLFERCQRVLAEAGARAVLFRVNPALSPAMPRLARRFEARPLGTLTAWRLSLGPAALVAPGVPIHPLTHATD